MLRQRVQRPKVHERRDRASAYWFFRYWHDAPRPDGSQPEVPHDWPEQRRGSYRPTRHADAGEVSDAARQSHPGALRNGKSSR